jgi:sugar O-acyltransferase (sialic acid O-acetyltransferase NeuD family)
MKNLLIYGAGGLGREILALVKNIGQWNILGFIDDHKYTSNTNDQMAVIGTMDTLNGWHDPVDVVLAIGAPMLKASIVSRISNPRISFPVIVHPNAVLMDKDNIVLGNGSIITAGCVLTTNIQIGSHVLINLNTTVGHDCAIGDYCSLMPGVNVAGEVKIEDTVLIGAGANIRNGVTIGKKSIVGMGAVLLKNVAQNTTVVGVPAKPLSQ